MVRTAESKRDQLLACDIARGDRRFSQVRSDRPNRIYPQWSLRKLATNGRGGRSVSGETRDSKGQEADVLSVPDHAQERFSDVGVGLGCTAESPAGMVT